MKDYLNFSLCDRNICFAFSSDLVSPIVEAASSELVVAWLTSCLHVCPTARKHTKQDSTMNEEWKSMFGSQEPPSSQPATVTPPDIHTMLCRVAGGAESHLV